MNNNKITPLSDRVLIQPNKAMQKTSGGLYIPDTAQKKPNQGIVVAIGPGKKDAPMVLKEGDKVIYGEYSGTEIVQEETKYLIMSQSDILALIKE